MALIRSMVYAERTLVEGGGPEGAGGANCLGSPVLSGGEMGPCGGPG